MTELKELLLQSPRWTLAVAESLTAGQVQARVAAASGASGYFVGGVTAYALDQKVKLLGVNPAEARRVNGVSSAVADQMARGVCALFGANVGVATTGYAEPSPADGVPSPFAWWAVAVRGRAANYAAFQSRHGRVECPGASRIEAQAMIAEAALTELVAFLRERRCAGADERMRRVKISGGGNPKAQELNVAVGSRARRPR